MPSKLTGRRRTIGSRGIGRSGRRDSGDDESTNLNKSTRLDKYATKQRISPVAKQALLLTAAVIVIGVTAFHFQKSLPFSLVNKRATVGNCELRTYPKRRYYGLNDRPLPDFLNTEYIYGELPRMLQPYGKAHTNTKLCVDQSEWYNPNETNGGDDKNKDKNKNKNTNQNSEIPALPFADGTNPSILKLVDNPRIDPSIRDFFEASGGSTPATTPYYLATICMTDSQCSWDLTPEEIAEFHLSPNDKPSTVRTVLLVLNRNFETLEEATIHARIDAFYGGRRNRRPPKPENQLKTFALDDARLFTHKGQIWVSYREGKLFGYEKQVLNQLHFDRVNDTEKTSDANGADGAEHSTKTLRATNAATSGTGNQQQQQLTVTFLASEVETLCCGRNMALIDNVHTNQLQALTWVDPVTVVDVDVHKTDEQLDGAAAAAESSAHRRRLSEANDGKNKNKKKSHMHGTNGFMVHLPSDGEYLGIGHFHRPNDRNKNEYARFGHHYTHAFFTISDKPPFRLKRLSPELVLPSHVHPEDAEVIQFWSGLELSSSKTLALVYGINDCEGAAIDLDLAVVENLLRDVPEGKEVVDFMMMPLHHR